MLELSAAEVRRGLAGEERVLTDIHGGDRVVRIEQLPASATETAGLSRTWLTRSGEGRRSSLRPPRPAQPQLVEEGRVPIP